MLPHCISLWALSSKQRKPRHPVKQFSKKSSVAIGRPTGAAKRCVHQLIRRTGSFEKIVENFGLENLKPKELDLTSKIWRGFSRILVQSKSTQKARFSQNPEILASPTTENVSKYECTPIPWRNYVQNATSSSTSTRWRANASHGRSLFASGESTPILNVIFSTFYDIRKSLSYSYSTRYC